MLFPIFHASPWHSPWHHALARQSLKIPWFLIDRLQMIGRRKCCNVGGIATLDLTIGQLQLAKPRPTFIPPNEVKIRGIRLVGTNDRHFTIKASAQAAAIKQPPEMSTGIRKPCIRRFDTTSSSEKLSTIDKDFLLYHHRDVDSISCNTALHFEIRRIRWTFGGDWDGVGSSDRYLIRCINRMRKSK